MTSLIVGYCAYGMSGDLFYIIFMTSSKIDWNDHVEPYQKQKKAFLFFWVFLY